MAVHYLKTLEVHWDRVDEGVKTAELRAHDRDFQTGDTIVLVRTNNVALGFVSAEQMANREDNPKPTVRRRITHVLSAGTVPDLLQAGTCMLSLAEVDQ